MPTSRFALLLVAATLAAAPLPLDEILKRFDQNARSFRAMKAQIERVDYTAVLKEAEQESGSIVIHQRKPGQVEMRIDVAKPAPKQIGYAGKKAMIYLPKINTVQIYDVGKYDSLISQGVLIGFGTTAAALQQGYTLKVIGEETIQNKLTTRLELTPKGDSPLLKLKKIEVWIQNSDGYPLRQKLYQGSGDYNQATYSDMKINPPVTDNDVRLQLPKDVKKEYPAK